MYRTSLLCRWRLVKVTHQWNGGKTWRWSSVKEQRGAAMLSSSSQTHKSKKRTSWKTLVTSSTQGKSLTCLLSMRKMTSVLKWDRLTSEPHLSQYMAKLMIVVCMCVSELVRSLSRLMVHLSPSSTCSLIEWGSSFMWFWPWVLSEMPSERDWGSSHR